MENPSFLYFFLMFESSGFRYRRRKKAEEMNIKDQDSGIIQDYSKSYKDNSKPKPDDGYLNKKLRNSRHFHPIIATLKCTSCQCRVSSLYQCLSELVPAHACNKTRKINSMEQKAIAQQDTSSSSENLRRQTCKILITEL